MPFSYANIVLYEYTNIMLCNYTKIMLCVNTNILLERFKPGLVQLPCERSGADVTGLEAIPAHKNPAVAGCSAGHNVSLISSANR